MWSAPMKRLVDFIALTLYNKTSIEGFGVSFVNYL